MDKPDLRLRFNKWIFHAIAAAAVQAVQVAVVRSLQQLVLVERLDRQQEQLGLLARPALDEL